MHLHLFSVSLMSCHPLGEWVFFMILVARCIKALSRYAILCHVMMFLSHGESVFFSTIFLKVVLIGWISGCPVSTPSPMILHVSVVITPRKGKVLDIVMEKDVSAIGPTSRS